MIVNVIVFAVCVCPIIVGLSTYQYIRSKKTNRSFGQFEDFKLHQIQQSVIESSRIRAKNAHTDAMGQVVDRFHKLGLTYDDLMNVIDYVKNVDPIIHIGRGGIDWLKNETRMKNRFELNIPDKNKGDYMRDRKIWECDLFETGYDECDDRIRPKYGCLNLMSDEKGCISAIEYGLSYIILKEDTKSRITFTYGDSSCAWNDQICTFDNFVQVFLTMSDITICDIVKIVECKKNKLQIPDVVNVNRYYTYIETQIHGDILMQRDVKHIMLHHEHASAVILRRLCKSQIPYTILDS